MKSLTPRPVRGKSNLKGTVRVTAGKLKGRAIPFVNSRFDNADITPQKVKGALFSMLGESLDGLVFLDLYAGSGQIGIEAISRGCALTVLNESDRKRYSFFREFLDQVCGRDEFLALSMEANSALRYLHKKEIRPDIIFLDPPYDKNTAGGSVYKFLFENLSVPGFTADDAVVVVQHYSKNELPGEAGIFRKKFTRSYGTTSLSMYESDAGAGSGDARDGHVSE